MALPDESCNVSYEKFPDNSLKIKISKNCSAEAKLEILAKLNQHKAEIKDFLTKGPNKPQFSVFLKRVLDSPLSKELELEM